MHPNTATIEKLFTSVDRHDLEAIADCYAEDATFQDIAFRLRGKAAIRKMWRMVVSGDIRVTLQACDANDGEGRAEVLDIYTPLLSASFRAAGLTTVALPTVAVAAYIKEDTTTRPTTKTRTESRFRRPCPGPFDSVFHQIKIHRFSDDRKMMAPAARMMSLSRYPGKSSENDDFR